MLFAGMYMCIFQPGNFTAWDSERVNVPPTAECHLMGKTKDGVKKKKKKKKKKKREREREKRKEEEKKEKKGVNHHMMKISNSDPRASSGQKCSVLCTSNHNLSPPALLVNKTVNIVL